MKKRTLGNNNLHVSALGLGCMSMTGGYSQSPDRQEMITLIRSAVERGVTFFDTAQVYGRFANEELVGEALAPVRDQVVIATKFGNTFDEATRQITGTNASPQHIRHACEASLRRLNTDYIDLYQFHLNDYDLNQAEEVRDTLETLVGEGQIRTYGWSTDFPERARHFAEGPHCGAIQHQMNVLDDAAAMVGVCEQLNLASINRGPLAMGLLSGKYSANIRLSADDVRGARSPEWMKYFKDGTPNPEWLSKLESIREILTSESRTLAQGALAWLWGRSTHTVPIPGFRTVAQIEENCAAMQRGPLTTEQIRAIDALLAR